MEAGKEMSCAPPGIARSCDIAMEGDRGRAAAHDARMELEERISRGDRDCNLKIHDR